MHLASANGMTPFLVAQNDNQFQVMAYLAGGGTTISTGSGAGTGLEKEIPSNGATNSSAALKSMQEREANMRKEQERTQKKIRIQQLKSQVSTLESQIKSDQERLAYYKQNWEKIPVPHRLE